MEGVWLETVAFPCVNVRYSMPLGVMIRGGDAVFRLFRGVGMLKVVREAGLERGFKLALLAPSDPMTFVDSYFHRLEDRLEWDGGCPRPDPSMGAWYLCTAELTGWDGDAAWYRCRGGLRFLAGSLGLIAYYRAYGCIIELLIIHSKLVSGAWRGGDAETAARVLEYCVARSAPERRDLADAASRLVQLIREAAAKAG